MAEEEEVEMEKVLMVERWFRSPSFSTTLFSGEIIPLSLLLSV